METQGLYAGERREREEKKKRLPGAKNTTKPKK